MMKIINHQINMRLNKNKFSILQIGNQKKTDRFIIKNKKSYKMIFLIIEKHLRSTFIGTSSMYTVIAFMKIMQAF